MTYKIHSDNMTLQNLSWHDKLKKGVYMSGAIMPARGSLCDFCESGKYVKSFSKILKTKVPLCSNCGEFPKNPKVRKVIPGVDGKSISKDFYYEPNGERLSDALSCVNLIKHINNELELGTFIPEKYSSGRKILEFSSFVERYLEDMEVRTSLPVEEKRSLSPNSLRLKKHYSKKLVEYFRDMELAEINKYKILEYYKTWTDRFRTRDLVLGELRHMLNYAWAELGILRLVPPFPILSESRKRKPEEIPPLIVQEMIIKEITNPKYFTMFVLMAKYMIRPCEVRALAVRNFDLLGNTFAVDQHFSLKELRPGRKSLRPGHDKSRLEFPLDSETIELIRPYLDECNTLDELIFKGPSFENGKGPIYVSHLVLERAWKVAHEVARTKAREAGLPSIHPIFKDYQLYTGTRHSSLSDARENHGSLQLLDLTGITNIKTLSRYAQKREGEAEKIILKGRFSKKVQTIRCKVGADAN